MKLVKLLAITLFIAVIVNCAKNKEVTFEQYEENGIRITKNNGIPADSTFNIELREIGSIDVSGEENPKKQIRYARSFDFDREGNLFIHDIKTCKIHKYSKDYEFIKTFGGVGTGPGEFQRTGKMLIQNDTLMVSDHRSWQISKFDTDGKFIKVKKYTDYTKAAWIPKKFGIKYVSEFNGSVVEEGIKYRIKGISLFDENLDHVKDIYMNKIESSPGKRAVGAVFSTSDNDLFISVNSKDEYKIDVYDLEGNKTRVIRKNYSKIKFSDEYIQKQEERNEKRGTNNLTIFKTSVYRLDSDKYGRLWVRSAKKNKEEGWKFDIFENDIFLKRIYLNIDKEYIPFLVRDKLITVNYDKNIIKIYDY